MVNQSAHQRFYQATEWVREDLPSGKEITPTNNACACCVRPWQQTENPSEAFAYQYAAGMAIEQVCATCYTPRIPAPRALGCERFAAGNPDNPVFGKLGMLPGSSGIITPDNQLHLALPPGFISKYGEGRYGKAGLIHETANAFVLLGELFEQGVLTRDSLADGIVFIEMWGRKADTLMGNLQMTRSLSEVWCCSDKGAFMLDLQALIDTGYALLEAGLLADATRPAFWKPIKNAATKGVHDDEALGKWAAKVEKSGGDAQAIVNKLPIDPASRLRVNEVLRLLAPYIEKGVL